MAGNAIWGCANGGIGASSALLIRKPELLLNILKV